MSIIHNYNTVISGGCQNNIDNLTTCHQQVINLGGNILSKFLILEISCGIFLRYETEYEVHEAIG